MSYEQLLYKSEKENIIVEEVTLPYTTKGLSGTLGDVQLAWIDKNLTSIEKKCILAEEIGHIKTSCGNILDQKDSGNRSQERRARKWAAENILPLSSLVEGWKNGCSNIYELADFLEVSEEFLLESLQLYTEKYGISYETNEYIVFFEPLNVVRKEDCE